MTIESTLAATTAATGRAEQDRGQIGADYESFLRLLTAQVANQDPLAPMDSTQFVSQLAQLSQVEQSVLTNGNLEDIMAMIGSTVSMSDVSLIGRDVTLPSETVELQAGMAEMSYELAETARAVRVVITDAAGTVVRSLSDMPVAGETRHDIVWDGRGNDGAALPDGIYKVEVNAETAAGETILYNTLATTRVEGVVFGTEGQILRLRNGSEVPSSQLVSVS